MEDTRTLGDHRVAQLRTAVVVAAAADLARTAAPAHRSRLRQVLVGAAAAVVLGLGAVAVAGAVGDGPAGPTPSAAATIEVDDGWTTVSVTPGAKAADVRDLLVDAGVEVEILATSPAGADPGAPGPDPATAAQAEHPVLAMATSIPPGMRHVEVSDPLTGADRAALQAAHEEVGLRMDFSDDGDSAQPGIGDVEFRQDADISVHLYVVA